jgi:signal transduction histidine kinase
MEERLEQYSKHLENLVEEKTKQLRDAERLVVIGQTAGMVGHDIRNPLQSIFGDIYLVKAELDSLPESEAKERLKESCEAIEKSVDYVNKIVLDLQDYAKPLKPVLQEAGLEDIIEDLLLKYDIPKCIKASTHVANGAKKIKADPTFLKRILGNLMTNAVQAMASGGNLTINARREATNVVITVQDTGVGIPEEVKSKLFTPLFTTKSKGQGFGLAVVKRLVEALNGTITFESKEGEGTTFTIKLPASAPKKSK